MRPIDDGQSAIVMFTAQSQSAVDSLRQQQGILCVFDSQSTKADELVPQLRQFKKDGSTVTSTSGASLISKVAVPDGTTQYQVSFSTNTPYDNNADGWYILYLQATQNALLNPNGASTGSFYAFAVRAYANSDGSCNSQVTLYKTVIGSVTQISILST